MDGRSGILKNNVLLALNDNPDLHPKIEAVDFCQQSQNYVCSCVLRIAREFFALLPIDNVLIHAEGDFLNTATGQDYEETILSVLIARSDLKDIQFNHIDCSDCISSFRHNMKFLKTKGFQPVDPLSFSEE